MKVIDITLIAFLQILFIHTSKGQFMKVCYFSSWAHTRPVPGTFTVDNIDPSLCTHIIYLFAVLDLPSFSIQTLNSTVDIDNNFYRKFTSLPSMNPALTAMIGIGGYSTTELTNYASILNSTEEMMAKFAKSVSDFCYLYNFKGVDYNIEYLDPSVQKSGLTKFIRILSAELRRHRFILSLSVSFRKQTIDNYYDPESFNNDANFINVMAVDMHGSWENKADHHAPLFKRPFETIAIINADFSVNYLNVLGIKSSKLNLAIPLYGRSFLLTDPGMTDPPAPANGPARPGAYTRERGFYSYYEICLSLFSLNVVQDSNGNFGPYAYSHNTWVGYDDVPMVARKAFYVVEKKLGGVAFWDITLDDFHSLCREGRNPLMQAVVSVLDSYPAPGIPAVLTEQDDSVHVDDIKSEVDDIPIPTAGNIETKELPLRQNKQVTKAEKTGMNVSDPVSKNDVPPVAFTRIINVTALNLHQEEHIANTGKPGIILSGLSATATSATNIANVTLKLIPNETLANGTNSSATKVLNK